jgi:hypothetical protein
MADVAANDQPARTPGLYVMPERSDFLWNFVLFGTFRREDKRAGKQSRAQLTGHQNYSSATVATAFTSAALCAPCGQTRQEFSPNNPFWPLVA